MTINYCFGYSGIPGKIKKQVNFVNTSNKTKQGNSIKHKFDVSKILTNFGFVST